MKPLLSFPGKVNDLLGNPCLALFDAALHCRHIPRMMCRLAENMAKVGVRAGSAFTKCRMASSVGSAM